MDTDVIDMDNGHNLASSVRLDVLHRSSTARSRVSVPTSGRKYDIHVLLRRYYEDRVSKIMIEADFKYLSIGIQDK